MIEIDGSMGEGGGQIIRTALALSVVTGKGFSVRNIRAGRKKPGLKRQHVASIKAAQEICGARALGADCLLYTSPSPRDLSTSRMPSSA